VHASVVSDRVPSLLVDIQTAQQGFFGNRGIRRYALGLARALQAHGAVRALLLNPERPWQESSASEIRDLGELSWTTRRRLRELDDGDPTAYVMTSPFERTDPVDSAVPGYVVESRMPLIAVLYDLIPEVVDVYPPSLMPAYWARRQLVKEADLLLTLSEHVRREAVERLHVPPERVAVIGAAASDFFRPRLPGEHPQNTLADHIPRITRPFVLSVTGWSAHKNVDGLVEAWSRLPVSVRREHQLVLTCPLPPGAETAWTDHAVELGCAPDDVVATGEVDDRVVRSLYQQAELLVLPSYEEGFGLPVLEAARCGCPAITSRTSSLPEVLQWKPATFPPEDPDAMAEVMQRCLLDPAFRADLRAVGDTAARLHTWDRVAERTIRACDAMPALGRARRVAVPRIAFVGRFTPPGTSAAMAVDRVAALLPPSGHLDRFDAAVTPRTRSLISSSGRRPDRGGFYPARAFGRARDPWGYDAIVYVVDADPTTELVDLARTYPGSVWFVEAPRDHRVAAALARDASVIVRPSDVPLLLVDPGPFGGPPVVTAPDDESSQARVVLESIGLPLGAVREPAG
jgi:glycosyltransferase involved in cell wall biosynthesis